MIPFFRLPESAGNSPVFRNPGNCLTGTLPFQQNYGLNSAAGRRAGFLCSLLAAPALQALASSICMVRW
jgi:hypothetical protein